jgi:myo-inositol 2-dehydrogenase/D-chiro-inositol 1-dehydrogenase
MSSTIRFGVIGAGRIGRVHAENLANRVPGAAVAWVADPDRAAADACAAAVRAGRATTDPHEILRDGAVDAVVIASPTDTHAALIEAAAAAGKDVFCEKPIDLDLARVDAALAAVARAGVRLQVGFNRRFDPSFAKARALIAEGAIGKVELVRITSRDPQPAPVSYLAASGGLFTDMTIHDFDVARWLVGDEIAAIQAMGAVLVDPAIGGLGDVDTAMISLGYRGGALGSIDNSRRAVYGYDVRVEVFGERGQVAVGNVAATSVAVSGAAGVRVEPPRHWFIERFEEAYVAELREFAASIREGRAPSVTGADGRAPLVLARAAWQSLREGRVVALDPAPVA